MTTTNAQRLLDNAAFAMMATKELVACYNKHAEALGEPLVKRFSDRTTAENRTAAIYARYITNLPAAERPAKVIEPALARGVEGKPSVHSRKSLEDQKAKRPSRKPKPEPEVKAKRAQKANRAAKGAKLALKQNKEVRALLTKAAQAAGATRLQPIGFTSYTEFLAGVPLDANGNAEVAFVPVKGNAPIQGKNVKMIINGGKVVKVK